MPVPVPVPGRSSSGQTSQHGDDPLEQLDQPRISTHTAMLSALDLPLLVEFELSWW